LQFHLTFWAFTKRHITFIFASFVNALLYDALRPQTQRSPWTAAPLNTVPYYT
jgi:hypothetical protein